MAYVQSLRGLESVSTDRVVEVFNAALNYAGGEFSSKLKAVYIPGGDNLWFVGFVDKSVDSPAPSDILLGHHYGENAYGVICSYAYTGGAEIKAYGSYYDTKFDIVATKYGIGILRSENLVAFRAGVLTLDNHGEFVSVLSGSADRTSQLVNPYVIPRKVEYTTTVTYPASTTTSFGCTSLSYIPVPTYDGSPHYLPNMAYANATQYMVNGPVLMGQKIWYCFGGAFYLYEGENIS